MLGAGIDWVEEFHDVALGRPSEGVLDVIQVTQTPTAIDALIARRRGPAKKKDDAEDARIACVLALHHFADLRALFPHGPEAAELRSWPSHAALAEAASTEG